MNKKSIAVTLTVLFLLGAGSSTLLDVFGASQGDINEVEQSIEVSGNTSYSGTYSGGQLAVPSPDIELVNNAKRQLTALVNTTYDADGNGFVSDVAGVNTSYIFYSTFNDKAVDDNEVEVEVTQADNLNSRGQYSVKVSSNGNQTTDYVSLIYPTLGETVSVGDNLTIQKEELSGNGASQPDEVTFYTESGLLITEVTDEVTSNGDEDTVKIDPEEQFSETSLSEANVVAVGLGYGDASATFGDDTQGVTMNFKVDNVRLENSNGVTYLEEPSQEYTAFPVVKTGNYTGNAALGDYNYTSRMHIKPVTEFDKAYADSNGLTIRHEVLP